MNLKIKTTSKSYFRLALEVLSAFTPFNSLRNREKDLLSQLLYYNQLYINVPTEQRGQVIFNSLTREKIMKNIDMKRSSLDSTMASLRKKGFITYNSINPKLIFKLGEDINIKFYEKK